MFSRLPSAIGEDDIFLGATTSERSVFPNSRLHSLNVKRITSSTTSSDGSTADVASVDRSTAAVATLEPLPNGANQLLSQYDSTIVGGSVVGNNKAEAISWSSNAAEALSSSVSTTLEGNAGFYMPAAPTVDEDEWWSNAIAEDTFDSPLAFDASEHGLWNGRFVPPPPRPPFLDESVAADGLTTCDLCTWAWQRNAYSLDGSIDTAGELGWAFTLIIVSIISALIGAIVMVIVLRCRRIKNSNTNGGRTQAWWCRNNRNAGPNGQSSSLSSKHAADSIRRPTSNSGVWTWLGGSRRSSAGPDQIGPPSSSPAENHYTHMDDAYSPVNANEGLYAELDRESMRSTNPSYQNTAYSQCGEKYNFQQHEQDIPMVVSSAPSSAYYSDLSVTAVTSSTGVIGLAGSERAYETVGLNVMSQPLPSWDSSGSGSGSGTSSGVSIGMSETSVMTAPQRRVPRLAAINETTTTTVPSDYV